MQRGNNSISENFSDQIECMCYREEQKQFPEIYLFL